MVDLSADVIPGFGAAGFTIGQWDSDLKFDDITRWDRSRGSLQQIISSTPGWLRVDLTQITFNQFTGYRLYGYRGIVGLQFSPSGQLYNVSVFSGYLGKYAEEIQIGDRLDKVLRFMNLWYDSGDELHYPTEESTVTGIAFIASEVSLEEDPNQVIFGISVHNWDLQ
jgi:hypothetical protein